MPSHARKTFRQLWWAPLLCYGLAWLADHYSAVAQQAEWHSVDWRTQFRAFSQPPPDPRLAVVLFDIHRQAMAKAIKKAMNNQPDIDWLLENQDKITHKYYQMGLDGKI